MSSNVFNQKLTFHLLVQIDLSGIQNLEFTVYNIFWGGGGGRGIIYQNSNPSL